MKPSRHEPCPCGSGFKLKDCCYIKGKADPAADLKLLELKKALIPRLMEYLLETEGHEAIQVAWHEFHGQSIDYEYDPAEPSNIIFWPWLLFNWQIQKQQTNDQARATITDRFITTNEQNLSTDELSVLKAANNRPYSYYQILEVNPGISLKILDLLLEKEIFVNDKTASKELEKGEIILCATMLPVFQRTTCIAIGHQPIPSILKNEIIELRDAIVKRHQVSGIDEVILHKESSLVIGYYLDLVEELQSDDSGEDE